MKIGRWAGLLAAAMLLAGCGDFWQAPSGGGSGFTLTNSGNITVSPGSNGNVTISVTPTSSLTGSVALSCSVTTEPSSPTSPVTCGLSPASLTFSSATAQSSMLTVASTGSTTTGTYDITVTGVLSGSTPATTVVCVDVVTGTCSNTASTSGYFYILNSSTLAGYYINAGTLTAVSNSSFNLTGGLAMAIDPNNHLWVATAGGITPYTINSSTGSLTQGTPISAFNDPVVGALQVDPSGKWLIDASLSGILYAYPITTSGTQDTSRSIQTPSLISTTTQPGGIAISPSGSTYPIIAVAEGTAGTQVFPFTSGNASPIGSPYSPTIAPYGASHGEAGVAAAVAVSIDPSNGFLYIGETVAFPSSSNGNSGALRVYAISSGSLNEISYTTPYASGGTTPHAILASSNGYIYVANWQGTSNGVVTEFLLNASIPSLTLQSNTVSTGAKPYGMAVDSTGDFVLVVNNNSTTPLSAFTFDTTTTGQLDTYSVTGSLGANPVAIVAAP